MLAPFSLTPVLDANGELVRTAALMVYQAGTTTPAVLYKSPTYTNGTEHPNPIPVNGAGLLPAMYGAGSFKLRLLTAPVGGSILWEADGVTLTDPPVVDSGEGDNTGLVPTGAVVQFYGTGSRVGYVRMNGRTMGNAASGATERASADTLALYLSLWSEDDSLVVVGGRGQTAQQDFDAGKAITLPDARGRVLASLDGMGGAATGSYGAQTWNAGGSATRLGSRAGGWSVALGENQLPAHSHDAGIAITPNGAFTVNGTTANQNISHLHAVGVVSYKVQLGAGTDVFLVYPGPAENAPATQASSTSNPVHQHSFTVSQPNHGHDAVVEVYGKGGGQAFSIANPFLLVTTYLKL